MSRCVTKETGWLRQRAARMAGELVYLHGFRGTARQARRRINKLWPRLSYGEVSAIVRALTHDHENGIHRRPGRQRVYGHRRP